MVMHGIREHLLVTKVMSWADRDQPIISVPIIYIYIYI